MSGSRRWWSLWAGVVVAALAAWGSAQQYLVDAQLEYQRSRLAAYAMEREARGLPGGALPAGEYSWTMDLRCTTSEACATAFGAGPLPDGEESFTFVARLWSNGTRMRYSGASVARGAAWAAAGAACGIWSSVGGQSLAAAPSDPEAAATDGVCLSEESGEAFVLAAPTHPLAALVGRPLLWLKAASHDQPAGGVPGALVACGCGVAGGLATPTVAVPGPANADYHADGGRLPPGVQLTVRLVKVQ